MAPAPARRRVELADLVRAHGAAYRQTHPLPRGQHRALRAIAACRTAALGGHTKTCDRCGVTRVAYNSCRNRHCPKCQTLAKERWLAARRAELLPVEYFHVVFTLPHHLNPLAQGNPRVLYGLLFRAARETLAAFGADLRHLGSEVGGLAILHTWGQTLEQHLHLHCVVPGGALARDGTRWRPAKRGFLFPVRALAQVFRGKYLAGLRRMLDRGELRFAGSVAGLADPTALRQFLTTLRGSDWVVYAKPPFGGPEQVLEYLGRYTHRVALSNDRLVSVDDGQVRFRWRDYAHGNRVKTMTLSADEFLHRFLLHVLPAGFVRIRHFGFLANRGRTGKLARCRTLLGAEPPPAPVAPEPVAVLLHRLTGVDIELCPVCRAGRLRIVAVFRPGQYPAPAWTAHEAPCCGPVVSRTHAPLRAEARPRVSPRPAGGWPRPHLRSVHPRSWHASSRLAAAKSFPRPLGSDTIPIARRPAVQFNPFYPAGPVPRSRGSTARGPPDKSLFVRRPKGVPVETHR